MFQFMLLSTVWQTTIAQSKYRAQHWGIDEGLTEDSRNMARRDIHGFIWFSSQHGLNRFDGSSFKNFLSEPGVSGSLQDDYFLGIIEDSVHAIWGGTNDGVARYDIKADTFAVFFQAGANSKDRIHYVPFWATRHEIFFCAADTTIVSVNTETFEKKTLLRLTANDNVGDGVSQQSIIFDSVNNSFWFSPGHFDNKPESGLLRIGIADGKRERFNWNCFRKLGPDNHFSEGMRLDKKRNSIWLASPDGLVEFTLADRQFHQTPALAAITHDKDFHEWAGIDIDNNGHIWIVTSPLGILRYDPETEQLENPFRENEPMAKAAAENSVYLYCDPNGMVWTASWAGGVYQLIPISSSARRYTIGKELPFLPVSVLGGIMLPVDSFHLWMTNGFGLNSFDSKAGKLNHIDEKEFPGLKGKIADVVWTDPISKKVWLRTNEPAGLYSVDPVTKKATFFILKDESGNPFNPAELFHNTLFGNGFLLDAFTTDGRIFFYEINPDSTSARPILSLKNVNVWRIASNTRDLLFLSVINETKSRSYAKQDGTWKQVSTPADTLDWGTLYFHPSDQTYWTNAGLQILHLTKDFKLIRKYIYTDQYKGAFLSAMIDDDAGNIWISSYKSIARLDTLTGNFRTLSISDGIENQRFGFIAPVAKDYAGKIYFAGTQGITKIDPEKLDTGFHSSLAYINSLEINQKEFKGKIGLNSLDAIDLRYNENNITIGTGIIDFYSTGTKQIRYRLDNLNGQVGEWQYAPNFYTIRYTSLAPGKYELVLEASGDYQNQFKSPQRSLLITIRPPFWATWWFRILAAIAILATVYAIIQNRSRSLQLRNAQLEEKVVHRTKELKQSLEELSETQSQLIQREKMASLGELTAGIAHEIQNPLNFVNNFAEVNLELIDEMKTEINNRNWEELNNLVEGAAENERKIVHHGKRADAIVKGMLQHSRTNTGVKEPTDLNALAEEYFRLSYHGLRAKDKLFNAAMQTDFDSKIGTLHLVPQDMGRVLLNLFNNAFYAVSEKKKLGLANYDPSVSLTTKRLGDKVEIRVKDNGLGIPKKVLEKIYQPFFTTKPTGEGTGLGLSLSYDIITKLHGGEIRVETQEGEGAEFVIRLPVG